MATIKQNPSYADGTPGATDRVLFETSANQPRGIAPANLTNASVSNYTSGGTGSTTRTVKTKLDEVVSVKDFGAVGDGVEHNVTTGNVTNKAALGFPGENKLLDLDIDDTTDFLGIQSAMNYLNSLGGGIVHVPAGHYIIARPLYWYDDVVMIGASREAVTIENIWPEGAGATQFDQNNRPGCLEIGHIHPVVFDANLAVPPVPASVCDHYTLTAADVPAGTYEIPLATAAQSADFVVGDQVLVRSRKYYISDDDEIPLFCEFGVVAKITSGLLTLDRPIKETIPYDGSNANQIVRLGTNTHGSWAGTQPYPSRLVMRWGIENITFMSTKHVWGEGAAADGYMRNIRVVAYRGITHNNLQNCLFQDIDIVVPGNVGDRAWEAKCCGRDVTFVNMRARQTTVPSAATVPMISFGEGSKRFRGDVSIKEYGFTSGGNSSIRISNCDDFRLSVSIESQRNGGTMLTVNGFPTATDPVSSDSDLALGYPPFHRFGKVSLSAKGSSAVQRGLQVSNKCAVTIEELNLRGSISGNALDITSTAGGYIVNRNTGGVSLSGAEAAEIVAVSGWFGCTGADLASATSLVNTFWKLKGFNAIVTTAGGGATVGAYYAAGPGATTLWRRMDGQLSITPA